MTSDPKTTSRGKVNTYVCMDKFCGHVTQRKRLNRFVFGFRENKAKVFEVVHRLFFFFKIDGAVFEKIK